MDKSWDRWLRSLLPGAADVIWQDRGESAAIGIGREVVVKVHHVGTDSAELGARLQLAQADWFVQPLIDRVLLGPGGRSVTVWPLVEVASQESPDQPWAEFGGLLAALHQTTVAGSDRPALPQPRHGWVDRMGRALDRAPGHLMPLGRWLLEQVQARQEPDLLIHGDWHLGQLGRTGGAQPAGWRLLDIDDVGLGDPAWDLARPAGFWAAGLLDDSSWESFIGGYLGAGGWRSLAPYSPLATADQRWQVLDLPARCAVFVAAMRPQDQESAEALVAACSRMAKYLP